MEKNIYHILLVEDQEGHIELFHRAFRSYANQFKLNVAYNLNEAKECLLKRKYDLIITDVCLPDGEGTELLPNNNDINSYPVIVMSSYGDETRAVKAIKAGALDYVIKSDISISKMPGLAERIIREWINSIELKKVEQSLNESNERIKLALNGANLGMWDINLKTDELILNDRAAEMVGYKMDEIEPHYSSWKKFTHPEDYQNTKELFNEHIDGKSSIYECEYRIKKKSGEYIWILDRGKIIERDKDGDTIRVTGTMLDITKIKNSQHELKVLNKEINATLENLETINKQLIQSQTELVQLNTELKTNEEKYRTLVENVKDIIYSVDTEGKIKYVSPAVKHIFEYTPEELQGKNFFNFIQKDNKKKSKELFNNGYSGDLLPGEHRVITKSGKLKWVRSSSKNIYKNNKLIEIRGVIVDITERVKAEEALRESEKHCRKLVENAPTGVVVLDTKGNIKRINPKIVEILDSPSEEATKAINLFSFKPLIEAGVSSAIKKCINEKLPLSNNSYYTSKWNKTSYFNYHLAPILDPDGKVTEIIINVVDTSERKQAEDTLQFVNEQLQSSINNMPIGYILWDEKFRIIEWNNAAEKIFGYKRSEVLGEYASDIIIPHKTGEQISDVISHPPQGESSSYFYKNNYIRRDGQFISC